MDQGDPHAGALGVLMMYDLYFYFSCKTKGSVISDHVETLTKTSLEFT